MVCLQCKTYHTLVGALDCTKCSGYILSGLKSDGHIALALDFGVRCYRGSEIGHGGTQDGGIGIREILHSRLIHLMGGLYVYTLDVGMLCGQAYGTCYECYIGTACGTLLGQCKTHLAG